MEAGGRRFDMPPWGGGRMPNPCMMFRALGCVACGCRRVDGQDGHRGRTENRSGAQGGSQKETGGIG